MTETLATRLARIRDRMEAAARSAGRDPDAVTLLAVSKYASTDAVREALAAGLVAFGESRVQDFLARRDALGDPPEIRWHMIGHLQKNKAKQAVGAFHLIHSLDSPALAERLDRLAAERDVVQEVLIQVNVAAEPQKRGVAPEEAGALVAAVGALPHLRPRGLMGMAPYDPEPEAARPHFRALAALFDKIASAQAPGDGWDTLSMGMSGDFEVAIEEGATIVRVGSALFGARSRS